VISAHWRNKEEFRKFLESNENENKEPWDTSWAMIRESL
jgi:hypothetical protein